jgi:peptidoglycan hydrolase FlgJ
VTVSKSDAPAYTDLKGLTDLKRQAGAHDPAAIRKVAQQFESMFTRMMLKSMRDASGKDPMFGSDQQEMYQGMADDQLAVELSKGKGLGLADMLVRQLQKQGVQGADQAGKTSGANGASADGTTTGARGTADAAHGSSGTNSASGTGSGRAGNGSSGTGTTGGFKINGNNGKSFDLTGPKAGYKLPELRNGVTYPLKGAGAYSTTQRTTGPTAQVSDTDKATFVRNMLPHAQAAGQQLGVDPGNLLAQAALETNWGQNLPQDSSGRSSNNLFGMKASTGWTGATVSSSTVEYQGMAATSTSAQFKAYATPEQSFQDYVSLLRDNPRYSGALNTGSNVQAFAAGLQRGGYATDPDYASKIAAVSHKVSSAVASVSSESDLKLADALPINANDELSGGAPGAGTL